MEESEGEIIEGKIILKGPEPFLMIALGKRLVLRKSPPNGIADCFSYDVKHSLAVFDGHLNGAGSVFLQNTAPLTGRCDKNISIARISHYDIQIADDDIKHKMLIFSALWSVFSAVACRFLRYLIHKYLSVSVLQRFYPVSRFYG